MNEYNDPKYIKKHREKIQRNNSIYNTISVLDPFGFCGPLYWLLNTNSNSHYKKLGKNLNYEILYNNNKNKIEKLNEIINKKK